MQFTQLGMTMGSPLYMSPEQAEGKPVDPRSDLYSFGATCYYMLAGRPPFTGDSPLAIAVQHVKSEPVSLAELRPDAPLGLIRIVQQLLAKRPQDRFSSAGEVLRALRQLRSEGVSEEMLAGLEEWSTPELLALELPSCGHRKARPTSAHAGHGCAASHCLVVAARVHCCRSLRRYVSRQDFWAATTAERSHRPPARYSSPRCAASQWYYAELVNTEDAWNAVAIYFPPDQSNSNRQWSLKADKGLADYYRRQGRHDEAQPLYERLTHLDPAEIQLRTQGYAGLACYMPPAGNPATPSVS